MHPDAIIRYDIICERRIVNQLCGNSTKVPSFEEVGKDILLD